MNCGSLLTNDILTGQSRIRRFLLMTMCLKQKIHHQTKPIFSCIYSSEVKDGESRSSKTIISSYYFVYKYGNVYQVRPFDYYYGAQHENRKLVTCDSI